MKGVKLSMQEQKTLKEGKENRLLGLKSISGVRYDALLQIYLVKNKIKFSNPTSSSVKPTKDVANNLSNEKDVIAKGAGKDVDLPDRQIEESKKK
ncbi:hypothetical protein GXP67_09915 [Rhodocytophaga rosea]|uniref:DUF3945 domain-containing protein n=1 Tax=Rhodocytophaga rosea TaxID=2704465 RepID=A0A6C0GGI5_9BACT|nr:hypothetical protein [Rhodocytophaga rosea]QHT66944.1 hypothetical protein GXP67_09915 [Rhodocytophaga rosea]